MKMRNYLIAVVFSITFFSTTNISNAEENPEITAKEELYIQQKQDSNKDVKVNKYTNEELFKMKKENNLKFEQDNYNNKYFVYLKKENVKQEISETDAIYLEFKEGKLTDVERKNLNAESNKRADIEQKYSYEKLFYIASTVMLLISILLGISFVKERKRQKKNK